MNCSDVHYLAPLYWSHELDGPVTEQLDSHLEICAACAHEFHEQSEFDQILRSAFSFEEIGGLRERVRAAVGLREPRKSLLGRGLGWAWALSNARTD
jgi:hypothetical protein